jgi:hypothetical protein
VSLIVSHHQYPDVRDRIDLGMTTYAGVGQLAATDFDERDYLLISGI